MTDKQTPANKVEAKPELKRDRKAPARGRQAGRRNQKPVREAKKYEEVVINIDRVTRVVKGGRRFRFKALVAVGDGKNRVGVGVAKATAVAEKNMITVPIENDTIPHEVETKVTGAQVLLMPAAPGTGVIAGGVVRSIIALTSIKNLLSKSLGSTNKVNIAYATIKALEELVPKEKWHKAPVQKTTKAKTTKKAEEK